MAAAKDQPIRRANIPKVADKKYAHITITSSFEDGTIRALVDKLADLIDSHNRNSAGRYGETADIKNITYVIEGNLLTKEAFDATFENTV